MDSGSTNRLPLVGLLATPGTLPATAGAGVATAPSPYRVTDRDPGSFPSPPSPPVLWWWPRDATTLTFD